MWRLDLVTCIVSSHAMVLNLTLCLQLPYMCKIQELQFTGHCIHIIFGADLHVFCLTAFHFQFIEFEQMQAIKGKCNYNRVVLGCFPSDKKSYLQPGLGADTAQAGGSEQHTGRCWQRVTVCFPLASTLEVLHFSQEDSGFPRLMNFAEPFHELRLNVQCITNVLIKSTWQSKNEYTCTVFVTSVNYQLGNHQCSMGLDRSHFRTTDFSSFALKGTGGMGQQEKYFLAFCFSCPFSDSVIMLE